MNGKTLILASAGSLLLAGAAHAEFTGVSFEVVQVYGEGTVTLQAIASFTDTRDVLQAVAGVPGNPLTFETNSSFGLFNDDDALPDGGIEDDIPFPLNGEFDSWIAMGETNIFSANFERTPDFWGVPGGEDLQVLTDGLKFISDDDTAYFFDGPGHAVGDLEGAEGEMGTGDVIIGQFTVNLAGVIDTIISYSGVIQWYAGADSGTESPFTATIVVPPIPAPSALALLGLAGLAGTPRRRHHR